MHLQIYTCMYTYIHTYIHIYIHTYIHTYKNTCAQCFYFYFRGIIWMNIALVYFNTGKFFFSSSSLFLPSCLYQWWGLYKMTPFFESLVVSRTMLVFFFKILSCLIFSIHVFVYPPWLCGPSIWQNSALVGNLLLSIVSTDFGSNHASRFQILHAL